MLSSYQRSSFGRLGVTPSLIAGNFVYGSTIDPAATYLFAKYAYVSGSRRPILVVMHGFQDGAAAATDAIMVDMAEAGFFAVAVGMRGRDNANGTPDVSGRETHDIIDAVEYVKAHFGQSVNPDSVHVTGYSGGGGNALALACKAPDYFSVVASHFGMSDYGYDETDGWGEQSPARQATLAEWIGAKARDAWAGGEPVNLNAYRARNAVEAIALNRVGGHVYLFHDDQDTNVSVSHSENVADAFASESNVRATLNVTTATDSPRWLHGMPHPVGDPDTPAGAPVRFTRDVWGPAALAAEPWIVPTTGTMRVLGYLKTKRFEVWLGDGTEHVADLTYDTDASAYTVTPLTGEVEVTVMQDGRSTTKTISTETTLTVLPVFFDSFTAENGTNLLIHSPDRDVVGGGWGLSSGTWQIQGGCARRVGAGAANNGITTDVGVSEHRIECVVPSDPGGVLVSTRVQDQDNYFAAGVNSARSHVVILERTAGSSEIRNQLTHAFTPDAGYLLVVTTTATGIKVEVDGRTLTYASTDKNTNTRVGLQASSVSTSGDTDRLWDDFAVWPL